MKSATVRGSALLGSRLRHSSGQDLGRIEEVVVEPGSGKLDYIVVSSPADSDRLVAIPWEAIRFPGSGEYLVTDVTNDIVERAPIFTHSNWPDMTDTRWRSSVRDYYGIRPAPPVVRPGPVETVPVRQSGPGFGAALGILFLVAVLGLGYLVWTRGWERTRADVVSSTESVANAMKETSEDVALTTKVKTALSLSRRVPAGSINVDSEGGAVTLRGQVPDEDVAAIAEAIARDTSGVATVNNQLTVNAGTAAAVESEQMRTRVADLETRYEVRDAIVSDERLRAEKIDVEVKERVVTLRGTVANPEHRTLAAQIARNTAGVQSVDNRIEISR